MFTIDPSISFGAILNAAVLLIGFVGAFTRIGGRIDVLSNRLGAVEETIKLARSTDSRLATIEERLTNHGTTIAVLQRVVFDLRHGSGFVIGPRRKDIEGEYDDTDLTKK